MNKNLKVTFVVCIIAIIAIVIYFVTLPKQEQQQFAGLSENVIDLVGSRSGTTTTPVNWTILSAYATQTATVLLGANIDTVTLNTQVINASTTNRATWYIEQSNDLGCNTATTSTSGADTIVTGDINWYDAQPYSADAAVESYNNGTTTFTWIAPAGGRYGISQTITDWNSNCLRFTIGGASTTIYVNLKAKSK